MSKVQPAAKSTQKTRGNHETSVNNNVQNATIVNWAAAVSNLKEQLNCRSPTKSTISNDSTHLKSHMQVINRQQIRIGGATIIATQVRTWVSLICLRYGTWLMRKELKLHCAKISSWYSSTLCVKMNPNLRLSRRLNRLHSIETRAT